MRQWFSDTKDTFRSLSQARRALLDKDSFKTGPFSYRIWHGHLFWLITFLKIEFVSYATIAFRKCIKLYCRTADLLFGGNRYQRYLDARRREVGECQKKIRKAEIAAQYHAEMAFELRLVEEALENPNYKPETTQTQ